MSNNGNIYCVPGNADSVLCIDLAAHTASTLGALEPREGKWDHGVLAGNGKIYCVPDCADSVLCIDPAAHKVSTFGALGDGLYKWMHGVLAGDGKIYCIPGRVDSVLCIDPAAHKVSTFGALGYGRDKWMHGVLAGDGKIYCVPCSADSVLCIDPAAHKVSTFGALGDGLYKWVHGVLAADGKIYCVPSCADSVLCIDPAAHKVSTFGALGHRPGKWMHGVLAADGKIYCVPGEADSVLCIDPAAHKVSMFGALGDGQGKWMRGVLAADGKIYCIPEVIDSILCIDPMARTASLFWAPGSGLTGWMHGMLAGDGNVDCAPHTTGTVLQNDPTHVPEVLSDQQVLQASVVWQYLASRGFWVDYHHSDSTILEALWSQWKDSPNPQDGGSVVQVSIGSKLYEVSFLCMQQRSLQTGTCRQVRRLDSQRSASRAAHQDVTVPSQLAEMQTELEQLRQRAQSAEQQLVSMQCQMEAWKHQAVGPVQLHPRPHLIPSAQQLLWDLVPSSHQGDCAKIQRAVVSEVLEVANMQLWKQYTLRRQQIAEALRHRTECPWAGGITRGIKNIQGILEHITLHPLANEVLLMHGTTNESAQHIVQQGFDERLAHRHLYGRGVYFTTDACKAAQYIGSDSSGCIIIARVSLGHPFLAEGPLPTHERPPCVPGLDVLHDSIVARPGIPKGKGKGKGQERQVHTEFVVPRGDTQIYPELLVKFRIP